MLKPRNQTKKKELSTLVLPLDECLAKTIFISSDLVKPGINVFWHCYLTGLVAREILKRNPEWLNMALFPAGSDLIVSLHDIGKVWHVFQEKIYRALRTDEYPEGWILNIANPEIEKSTKGHAEVSQVTIFGKGEYISAIVGRHHGFSSARIGLPTDEIYGGAEWQKARETLIELLQNKIGSDWPVVETDVICNVLTGLTCVCDWVSSGAFPEIGALNTDAPDQLKKYIETAVDNAGFIQPRIHKDLSFEDVFGFTVHPLQDTFLKCVDSRGVYILEAPMGLGKTEAALYAAYKQLENGEATGIYFALPTQLTSDKMHERMHRFLEKILECDSPNRNPLLLHSNAWLRKTDLGEEGEPGRSWFESGKRGILAPFAVGTVDQALMAAMNVKHGFVRTYGLAGKVVILDEIHSYDMYTGTLLDELVNVLVEIQCTVIILSATLTAKRKQEVLGAVSGISDSVYPLISKKTNSLPVEEYAPVFNDTAEVQVSFRTDESLVIEDALRRAESGQQVLWIENTIGEAQALYKNIGARAANCGVEYGLLHSRFIRKDRESIEKKWVDLFGKNSGVQRKMCGRILIGTQILEQSLDIDADFLVTRLCPSDMLFQRTGRLWRHRVNDSLRPANAIREIVILAPSITDAFAVNGAFGKTGKIYEPYLLCRTLELWNDKRSVSIPQDIPIFLRETYLERSESGLLSDYKHSLELKCEKLRRLALIGISSAGSVFPEEIVTTRHSDYGTVDVLLLRSRNVAGESTVSVRFLDDSALLINVDSLKKRIQHRAVAAELLRNTVRVPNWIAPQVTLQQMKWLKPYMYIGNDKGDVLCGAAKVRPGGEVYGLGDENPFSGYHVTYTANMGYCAIKMNTNEFD